MHEHVLPKHTRYHKIIQIAIEVECKRKRKRLAHSLMKPSSGLKKIDDMCLSHEFYTAAMKML